ncbi:capZ-interacting protein isoform X2 [Eucyclogobius newberryi]|uniref:capZ-interacting protein isoform X2 n=1 Tax=Eucyclogobius newberryi TaxID=166745 RepID=UPI003B5A1B57
MEKDSPSKPSVAELAGRFKGHILPMPISNDGPSFRRRPPCSLKLPIQKDDNEDSLKTISPSNPLKVRTRNSALIEKLQSPDVKLQPAPLSPSSPKSPTTPLSPSLRPLSPQSPGLRPALQSSEEEDPVGFETPAEGIKLPNINKTRVRLSFKRRPPTRQHRRSAGEEPVSPGSAASPCELSNPNENGLSDQVFDSPAREEAAAIGPDQEEAQDIDRDCDTIEEEVTRSHPEDSAPSKERGKTPEGSEGEQQPSEPCAAEGEENEEELMEEKMEEMSEEADQDGNEEMKEL